MILARHTVQILNSFRPCINYPRVIIFHLQILLRSWYIFVLFCLFHFDESCNNLQTSVNLPKVLNKFYQIKDQTSHLARFIINFVYQALPVVWIVCCHQESTYKNQMFFFQILFFMLPQTTIVKTNQTFEKLEQSNNLVNSYCNLYQVMFFEVIFLVLEQSIRKNQQWIIFLIL